MRTPLFFGNISYYLSYTIILDTTFQTKNQVVLLIFAVLYKFYIKFNKNLYKLTVMNSLRKVLIII